MSLHAAFIPFVLALLLALGLATPPSSAQTLARRNQPSESGLFNVSFTAQLTPITINRIHNWLVHVEDPTGAPVANARIMVGGGMPAHNHGLPTSPRMTRYLGSGDYLIEGMKFHMNGSWEITFDITAAGVSDRIVFRFAL
jgi:hypothetical protein